MTLRQGSTALPPIPAHGASSTSPASPISATSTGTRPALGEGRNASILAPVGHALAGRATQERRNSPLLMNSRESDRRATQGFLPSVGFVSGHGLTRAEGW